MRRLIYADKLKEKFDSRKMYTGALIKEFIDMQSTVYDVDDVTEKIGKEIRICNAKLYDNSNTVNVLAICERRQALREVLRLIDKDVMV